MKGTKENANQVTPDQKNKAFISRKPATSVFCYQAGQVELAKEAFRLVQSSCKKSRTGETRRNRTENGGM